MKNRLSSDTVVAIWLSVLVFIFFALCSLGCRVSCEKFECTIGPQPKEEPPVFNMLVPMLSPDSGSNKPFGDDIRQFGGYYLIY